MTMSRKDRISELKAETTYLKDELKKAKEKGRNLEDSLDAQ